MESIEQPDPETDAEVGDALPPDTSWRFVVTTLLVIAGVVCMATFSFQVGYTLWIGAYGIAARIPFPGQRKRDTDKGSDD